MRPCDTDLECEYRTEDGKCGYHSLDRPTIVAVDLDGVIAEFDEWNGLYEIGEPIKKNAKKIRKLDDSGCLIVIWTTRNCDERVAEYLNIHNIPFDHINDHPYQTPDMSNKMFADYYLSDREDTFLINRLGG